MPTAKSSILRALTQKSGTKEMSREEAVKKAEEISKEKDINKDWGNKDRPKSK